MPETTPLPCGLLGCGISQHSLLIGSRELLGCQVHARQPLVAAHKVQQSPELLDTAWPSAVSLLATPFEDSTKPSAQWGELSVPPAEAVPLASKAKSRAAPLRRACKLVAITQCIQLCEGLSIGWCVAARCSMVLCATAATLCHCALELRLAGWLARSITCVVQL